MHRRILSAVLLALGFLALGLPAAADPITVGASARVDELACSSSTIPQPDQCTGSQSGGSASASADVSSDFVVGTAQASVHIDTTPFAPEVHLSVSASNSSPIASTSVASASGSVTDAMSLGAPLSGPDSQARVLFRFVLTGDVVIAGSTTRSFCLDIITALGADEYCASNTGASGTANAFTFTVQPGRLDAVMDFTAANYAAAMAAVIGELTYGLTARVVADTGETASLDFSSTLQLTEISIRDLEGNLIPGFTLTSAAGFNYPFLNAALEAPGEVPEPATLAVLGAALAGLALRRSFRPR